MTDMILRLPAVKARTGLSRSTIYFAFRKAHFLSPSPWAAAPSDGSLGRSMIGSPPGLKRAAGRSRFGRQALEQR